MRPKPAILSMDTPITVDGRAYYSIDTPMTLRQWLSFFHRLFNTYGDVEAKTDAGYNNVSLVLTIKRGEGETKARIADRQVASMGQSNRQARSKAPRTQARKKARRR